MFIWDAVDQKGRLINKMTTLPLLKACYGYILDATNKQFVYLDSNRNLEDYLASLDNSIDAMSVGYFCVDAKGYLSGVKNTLSSASQENNQAFFDFYQAYMKAGLQLTGFSTIKKIFSIGKKKIKSSSKAASSAAPAKVDLPDDIASTYRLRVPDSDDYWEDDFLRSIGVDATLPPAKQGDLGAGGAFGDVRFLDVTKDGATEKVVIKTETDQAYTQRARRGGEDSFAEEAKIYEALHGSSYIPKFRGVGTLSDEKRIMVLTNEGSSLDKITEADPAFFTKENNQAKFHQFLFQVQSDLIAKKISYNDWKPENIVYNQETKEFKLIDFGASRKSKDDLTSTDEDGGAGSKYTMAPELFPKPGQRYDGHNISESNSFSIGAAIVFAQNKADGSALLRANGTAINASLNTPAKTAYYEAIRRLGDQSVPPYVRDMMIEDPSKRLKAVIHNGEIIWVKKTDEANMYQIFNPITLSYVGTRKIKL